VLVSVVVIAALARVATAEIGGLTLADAVDRALRDGTDAKLARLEAEQAGDALGQARSAYWPHAAVKSQAGWSNRQNDTLDAVDGTGPSAAVKRYPLSTLGSDQAWLSVFFDQLVFDLSQWRGLERHELEAEAAAVAEAQQRESISFAVVERYLAVLKLEALVALDARRVDAAEWLARQAGLLLESGRALSTEREQAVLHLDETRADRTSRRDALEDARAALARAIGEEEDDGAALRLVPDSVPTAMLPSGNGANEDVLCGAPELRLLELRRRMEELTLAAVRAERLPTLSLRGGYFHYGTKRFDSFEDEVAVGVDLKVPVFDGFRTASAIDSATRAAAAARLRYEAMRQGKRARVRDLARRLTALLQQPALADRRAAAATERQRLADLGLQAQRGTLVQALAARVDAAREAQAAIDARFDRVLLWATLQRETGRLATTLGGTPATAQP
jgi:outer membrane protein TolC